jgi:hypothetical protein
MALNIKNEETEKLAAEVASLAGETKTGAVKQALRERRDRLQLESGEGKSSTGVYGNGWERRSGRRSPRRTAIDRH